MKRYDMGFGRMIITNHGKYVLTSDVEPIIQERDNYKEILRELVDDADQIVTYVEARKQKPLIGIGDSVHSIHPGTQWFAEITFSQLEKFVFAIARTKEVLK